MVEALHQLVEQAQILAIDYAKFVVESPLQKTIAKRWLYVQFGLHQWCGQDLGNARFCSLTNWGWTLARQVLRQLIGRVLLNTTNQQCEGFSRTTTGLLGGGTSPDDFHRRQETFSKYDQVRNGR
jgi:hypothetical protein